MTAATIRWICFDDTVSVPVLSPPFALSRESVIALFQDSNAGQNVLVWNDEGVSIHFIEDPVEDAEQMNRVEIDGVEMFTFTTAPYQWNESTEDMAALGFTAEWVPGAGIVVTEPDTSPETAAKRLIEGIEAHFGRFVPNRLNSWAEYFAKEVAPEGVFFSVGIKVGDAAKQEATAAIVDEWLRTRAAALPTEGSIRADELTVGQGLDARTLRIGYWSPQPDFYTVTRVEVDGEFVEFDAEFERWETITRRVPADRRFDTI